MKKSIETEKSVRFQRAPVDEMDYIANAAAAESSAFKEIRDSKDYACVKTFFDKFKIILDGLNKDMIEICDTGSLTEWINRVKYIKQKLDVLEKNLAVVNIDNGRLFDWLEVANAMGVLNVIRVGAQQTILLNQAFRKKVRKTKSKRKK